MFLQEADKHGVVAQVGVRVGGVRFGVLGQWCAIGADQPDKAVGFQDQSLEQGLEIVQLHLRHRHAEKPAIRAGDPPAEADAAHALVFGRVKRVGDKQVVAGGVTVFHKTWPVAEVHFGRGLRAGVGHQVALVIEQVKTAIGRGLFGFVEQQHVLQRLGDTAQVTAF